MMQVAQKTNIDNESIIINDKNEMESVTLIEEIPNVTSTTASVVKIDGISYPIGKVGKIKGTDWLVFQLKDYPLVNKLAGKSFTAELLQGGNVNVSYDRIQSASNVILQLGGDYKEILNTLPYIQIYMNNPSGEFTKTSGGSLLINIAKDNVNDLGQVDIARFISSSGNSTINNQYAIRGQAINGQFGYIYQSNDVVWHTATVV